VVAIEVEVLVAQTRVWVERWERWPEIEDAIWR